MRLFLTIVFLLSTLIPAAGQQRIPIYRSTADSVELNHLQETINTMLNPSSGTLPRVVDSVRAVYREKYQAGVTGFRYVYKSNPDYTSINDLLDGKVRPEDVKRLSISDFHNKRLPRLLFQCINLEKLEFVNSNVAGLPRKLGKLDNLRSVAIYNNKATKHLRLARNSTINYLAIRSETPRALPRHYKGLKALDTLDLKRNNMTAFPDVSRNRSLLSLNVAENRITLSERTIKANPTLKHIALQHNRVTQVSEWLGEFKGLRKLVLSYNEIADLPTSLSALQDLEELSLYNNRLTFIPDAVYTLKQLRFLDLYFNEIEKIEDPISRLSNLEILYIASNRIYSISDSIGELSNLRELFIHHNRLSALPVSLEKLKNLQVLRMNANRFVTVPDWIANLAELRTLDVSQNMIIHAPRGIASLRHLELVVFTENAWENRAEISDLADTLAERGVIVHLEEEP